VTGFNATNTTGGTIDLNDAVALLTITGITQDSGGPLTVTNSGGGITTTGAVTAVGNGQISLLANGTVTVNAAITAGIGNGPGGVLLFTAPAAADIVINSAAVSSTRGLMTVIAGGSINLTGTASITRPHRQQRQPNGQHWQYQRGGDRHDQRRGAHDQLEHRHAAGQYHGP